MRRKRLKHCAFVLCHMFCGWRLANCYPQLLAHGPGALEVDALTGECWFDGRAVEALSIALELQGWLRDDLAAQGIPPGGIARARLRAALDISAVNHRRRATRTVHLGRDGKPVRAQTLHRCVIRCEGEIATDEAVYRASYQNIAEWPPGWPAAEPVRCS